MRVAPEGGVTLANAGHLPPYLNGKEMSMEGALPLGIMADAEFPVAQFALQPGDRLTLLTDGIVEAQNKKRELFGFARANDLVRRDGSAAEIAAAAQSFGQNDDITVLCVAFTGATEEVLVR
jgi:serine phosphatase RsbU (regulator of sigma subunit)